MRKFFKRSAILIISFMTALCACAGLSACSSKNGGKGDTGAASVTGKWDEYEGVKIAFADEAAYGDGEIDESKVLPELNCKLGEKQYMVINFDIIADSDNDGRETVTAEVQVQPATAAKATIQDTNTGTVSEETNGEITTIKATYKIPEKANSPRNMLLVIQFEAAERGLADVGLSFINSGEIQGVKTDKIEKSAVMGYTDGLEYELGNTCYTVKGLGDSTAREIVIPSLINGYIVTGVGISAFNGCSKIISVTMPNSVTSIYGGAFSGCSELKTVKMQDSVISIHYNAFENCNKLQYNEYDNALYLGNETNKYIALVKAKDTDITSCTINENIKLVCAGAFEYCSKLKSITLPNGIMDIGLNTFYNCRGLESVFIPESVTEIGYGAFYNCRGLKSITIPNGLTIIGDTAFQYCIGLINVTIPNSITKIGWGAFYDCGALANITFMGNEEQWEAIQKSALGNDNTGDYVVCCTTES